MALEPAGLEPAGLEPAVPRAALKGAAAVAVPEGAVAVAVGRRMVLAVDREATVPRGPSGRAALSESWVNPDRSSPRRGHRAAEGPTLENAPRR